MTFIKKNASKTQVLTGFYLPSEYQDNLKDILLETEKKTLVLLRGQLPSISLKYKMNAVSIKSLVTIFGKMRKEQPRLAKI